MVPQVGPELDLTWWGGKKTIQNKNTMMLTAAAITGHLFALDYTRARSPLSLAPTEGDRF